jgi:hydroxyethylthiazole kinase
MLNDQIASALDRIKQQRPLIHHITNLVVMNDTANLTLHLGALPVMAHAIEEVAEVSGDADALLLNLGTLTPERAEAMWVAGRTANARADPGTPIVMDPVGVGATRLRTHTALRLVRGLRIAVVRGNAGEILSLDRAFQASGPTGAAGETAPPLYPPRKVRGGKAEDGGPALVRGGEVEDAGPALVRGVESVAQIDDPVALARAAASRWQTVVAIGGARDVLSDGTRVLGVENGHRWLTAVTGTGCMASAAVAAFAAVEPDALLAAAGGLAARGLAAERAAQEARGPASFKVALLDAVYGLTPEDLRIEARIVSL